MSEVRVVRTEDRYLDETLDVLAAGGVVISPSITNYILICDATNPQPVDRIFEIKRRSRQSSPLSIAVPCVEDIARYAHVPSSVSPQRLEALLPGEVLLIFEHRSNLPAQLFCGLSTVAVTVSSDRVFGGIVSGHGKPIAGTSANISGQGNIFVSLEKAVDDIGDLVDLVLDGGPTVAAAFVEHSHRANTIVDFTQGRPWLVREGWVTTDRLLEVFPDLNTDTVAYRANFLARAAVGRHAPEPSGPPAAAR